MVKLSVAFNGIEIPPRREHYSGEQGERMATVLFRVQDGTVTFEIPIVVDRSQYDDADLVNHARRVIPQLLDDLLAKVDRWRNILAPRNWAAEPRGSRPEDAQPAPTP